MYCLTYMLRGHSSRLCTRELNMSQKGGYIWSKGCGGIKKRPRGSDPVRTSNCTYNSSIRAISFAILIYIHLQSRIWRFQCVSLDIHRVRVKTISVWGTDTHHLYATQFLSLTVHTTLQFDQSLLQYWSAYIYNKEYQDFSALALIFIE